MTIIKKKVILYWMFINKHTYEYMRELIQIYIIIIYIAFKNVYLKICRIQFLYIIFSVLLNIFQASSY